ncbi:hypothetical protein EDB89DRAFT_2075020 [Lactarius sanguifluus]|nr:hypothetical protein EDB89DRAFT_2075020 [Lactarius sanguifluus]
MPQRFTDYFPHGDMSLDHVPPRAPTPPECNDRSVTPETVEEPPSDPRPHPFQTHVNKLGIFRRYTHTPTWLPKHDERFDLVCDSPSLDAPRPPDTAGAIHEVSHDLIGPFPNFSVAMYMGMYFSGMDTKSEEHASFLAKTMQDDRFDSKHLAGFSAHVENVRLDKYLTDGEHPFQIRDGWQESTVHIRLPLEGKQFNSEDDAPMLPIHRLFHRRITDIIRSVCSSKAVELFHLTPYTMHWRPDPLDPDKHERLYAETYTSDAMIQVQTEVDDIPRQEGDTRECIVLGLMLASDSAQLTSFGSASVWPVYLMFANQSKQERVKLLCHAVHHLAYVPSLGGDFTSRYQEKTEQAPSQAIEVHCKHELMHAMWNHLLDDDFIEGSTNGLNAFSDVLSKVGQDYHNLFVVDLLHEFEIGVWKSVLAHLIRMLYAIPGVGRDRIAILDSSVPTFGRDTIRKFPGNVSGLSKLAARDYEDILQCAIPVFGRLFLEEDNRSISKLLFLLATWHTYAKLRLHTDTMLEMFEAVGASLCQALRYFATVTCPRYTTKELQREANARATRQREKASRNEGPEKSQKRTAKAKKFNMSTFKIHCIPDYMPAIRKYGTTDSYSTQTSELAHRLSKMWYRSSNKNRGFIGQITSKESRTRFYAAMLAELEKGQSPPNSETRPQSPQPPRPEVGDDALSNPSERYWMSKSSVEMSTSDTREYEYSSEFSEG